MAAPHPYGACHFEDCPRCERIAQAEKDDMERPSPSDAEHYENEAQDRYERQLDAPWR